MGPTLRALLDLQEIDLQIVEIRAQLRRRERLIATQEKKLETCRAELKSHEEQIRRAQAEFHAADVEVKARSGHIDKLREQLNSVRTNKEYAALLAQLNNEKADLSKFESRTLEMMQGVDSGQQTLASRRDQVAAEERRLHELQGDLATAQQTVSGRLGKLEAQRSAALAAVPPEVLQRLHKLSERHEGQILAEVICENARRGEFSCGGCHMSLAAEVANALRVRDDVLCCPNCGRILYVS